jgi:hypothetical protein
MSIIRVGKHRISMHECNDISGRKSALLFIKYVQPVSYLMTYHENW